MKRTPIKKISDKRRIQLEKEKDLKVDLWNKNGGLKGNCECPIRTPSGWQFGCYIIPCDKHEIINRGSGGNPLDPFNCALVCRHHHQIQDRQKQGDRCPDDVFLELIRKKREAQGYTKNAPQTSQNQNPGQKGD